MGTPQFLDTSILSQLTQLTQVIQRAKLFHGAQLAILNSMKRKAADSDVVDIIEAAQMLGISVGTLRRRVADKTVKPLPTPPLLKQPKKLLFLRSEIERLRGS